MARGLAAEVGYDFTWQNEFATIEEGIEAAIKKYNKDTVLAGLGEVREKEREHLGRVRAPDCRSNEAVWHADKRPDMA